MNSKVLMGALEAYHSIYNEALSEEVQVENWINSLVEEGYDLSEYTWEDMYEAYITEIGFNPAAKGSATKGAVTTYGANDPRRTQSGPVQSRFARPMNAGTPQTFGGGRVQQRTVRPAVASLPTSARQVTQYPQGVSTGVGGGNAAASRPTTAPRTPATAPRPVATAPRPVATAPRPVATAPRPTPAAKPAPTATAKPVTQPPESRTQASAGEIRGMVGRSMERQAAATPAAKPTPTAPSRPMGSRKPGSIVSGLDMFDLVKGHLLGEGYADTEEAALAIMANMSEEWKQSIIEMGENIGKEPKTVGKSERPGVKGETYAERQKRMKPSSGVKPA